MTSETVQRPAPDAWSASELQQNGSWRLELDEEQVQTLEDEARRVLRDGSPRMRADNPPPAAERLQAEMKNLLHGRLGFCVVRGLRPDLYTAGEIGSVYLYVSSLLGDAIPQGPRGEVFVHVRDTRSADSTNRGFPSSRGMDFHTDGGDIVGLFCIQAGRSGGESQLISSAAMYNAMLANRPDLAEVLFEPWHFRRPIPNTDGSVVEFASPLASMRDGIFSFRHTPRFVHSARRNQRIAGLSAKQQEVVDWVDNFCNMPDVAFSYQFARGDVQFINNYSILHNRNAYTDWPDLAKRRHLLRLWIRSDVRRPLVPGFRD